MPKDSGLLLIVSVSENAYPHDFITCDTFWGMGCLEIDMWLAVASLVMWNVEQMGRLSIQDTHGQLTAQCVQGLQK